jgi:hypothetical protein
LWGSVGGAVAAAALPEAGCPWAVAAATAARAVATQRRR